MLICGIFFTQSRGGGAEDFKIPENEEFSPDEYYGFDVEEAGTADFSPLRIDKNGVYVEVQHIVVSDKIVGGVSAITFLVRSRVGPESRWIAG